MAKGKHDYGSGYLYAEDLLSGGKFHTATVEIAEVHEPGTLKSADGKLIDKWVIGFKGKDKRLVLNSTNTSVTHTVTGEPPGTKWIGHTITLQAREFPAFGGQDIGIRVIPPQGTLIRRKVRERLGVPAEYHGNAPMGTGEQG